TGIALAAQRDVIPGGHARRHLDVDRLLGRREPAPAARLADVLDQLTLTTACGARRDARHLAHDRTLHGPQLARAAARPAPPDPCAACRPRARARGAWVHDRNPDRPLHARRHIRQRQAKARPHVRTPPARSPTPPARTPAEQVLEPAAPAEIPHEDFERVREADSGASRTGPGSALHPPVADTVGSRP